MTKPSHSPRVAQHRQLPPTNCVDVSRRQMIAGLGLVAAAAWLVPRRLMAADDGIVGAIKHEAAVGEVTVRSLRGNVSVLTGSGGNIAVLPGPDGKVLVDAGIGVSRPKITRALAGLSDDPIRHLVNTHWHFDHTDGNRWLHEAGASIVAHETTRKRLSVPHRVDGWRFDFPAAPRGALPTVLFTKSLVLDLNGTRLHLEYYEPAHTDCDIAVHFSDADVRHVGDTWWNGYYPFIDYSSGGNIDGSIDAAEVNVARTTGKTIVFPGHGPIGDRAGLIEFRDMLVAIRAKVADLKQAGRSIEEAAAAKPTAAFDEKWGQFVTTPDAFTRLVYQGV